MSFDLTNKNISDTFQNLLQSTGSDGRLYDLTGNEIGNLRISGSLTAQQYIVSSSVTNIAIQQLSGSTKFGDTQDDIHQFTGSLDSSGSIYVGDKLYFNAGTQASPDYITNNSVLGPQQSQMDFHLNATQKFQIGSQTTTFMNFSKLKIDDAELEVDGHITASGNISASGNIIGNQINANSFVGGNSVDDTHSFTGTGSFDILGIGGAAKTTPLAKLHVRDSVNPQLRLDSATIATRYATFQVDEDNNAFVIDGTYGKMQFKNGGQATDQFIIFGNGLETPKLTSNGAYNLTLNTNQGVNDDGGEASGYISLQHDKDGDISVIPHGSGSVILGSSAGTIQFSSDTFLDGNGEPLFDTRTATSAVNTIGLAAASTGDAPKLVSTGSDTNINLQFETRGSGKAIFACDISASGDFDNHLNDGAVTSSVIHVHGGHVDARTWKIKNSSAYQLDIEGGNNSGRVMSMMAMEQGGEVAISSSLQLGKNVGDNWTVPVTGLAVEGDISASGDLYIVGNISGSTTSTGSFGKIESVTSASITRLDVTNFETTTGSFGRITSTGTILASATNLDFSVSASSTTKLIVDGDISGSGVTAGTGIVTAGTGSFGRITSTSSGSFTRLDATNIEATTGSFTKIESVTSASATRIDGTNIGASGDFYANSELVISGSGTVMGGWHGSNTKIKLLARDFHVDDDLGRPLFIEDDTAGAISVRAHGATGLYATLPIPMGYKATQGTVYGADGTNAVKVYQGNITGSAVQELDGGSCTVNSACNFDDLTATDYNYLWILVTVGGSTDLVYGGEVVIEKV